MKATTAFNQISQLKSPLNIIQGGTSAGKTYSLLTLLILRACKGRISGTYSIVSESFPHLRRGAMADFFNILKRKNLYNPLKHEKSKHTYTIKDTIFEFFSAEKSDKLRGSRREGLFINEANGITHESFDELDIRTKGMVYLDFNPVSRFWAHDLIDQPETSFLKLNYTHNEAIDAITIKKIEERKHNHNWWRVYGLGEIGELEGLVFPSEYYHTTDGLPKEALYLGSGMDFGFANDPTAIIDLYRYNGGIIADERIYQTHLSNSNLIEICKEKSGPYICDCSDSRTINELQLKHIGAIPCKKGKDSIQLGIERIKDIKIGITKSSLNLLKEMKNYMYIKQNDRYINTPIDQYNHAIDALRYGFELIKPNQKAKELWTA